MIKKIVKAVYDQELPKEWAIELLKNEIGSKPNA